MSDFILNKIEEKYKNHNQYNEYLKDVMMDVTFLSEEWAKELQDT
tara:strand:+ start:1108 stop:1242 length:135 start_codon:yes stop_codon:yes gene_type:complete